MKGMQEPRTSPNLGKPSPQKGKTYEREVYTSEEMHALLDRTSSDFPSAVRNYALIMTLWQSGLRINEALDLRPTDFDLTTHEIFVRHGKGNKARRVRCRKQGVASVARWLGVRSQLGLSIDAPLFCTLQGKKLYSSYFRNTLQRLARRAGWTKRIHPHGFRHTFASALAKKGVPMHAIREQLGHASLATTSVYLSSISVQDVEDAMQKIDEEEW